MPCWSIQENPLGIKDPSPEVLIEALKELGYTINDVSAYGHFSADHFGTVNEDLYRSSVQIKDGRLVVSVARGCSVPLEEVSRRVAQAYGRQVVQQSARRLGWQVKKVGENKFQVTRRY